MSLIQDKVRLEYHFSLLKDEYLLFEPVKADVWVKNVSSESAEVFFSRTEGWVIEDEYGRVYPSRMHVSYGSRRLAPGDSLGGVSDLSHYGKVSPQLLGYFPEGNYKLYYRVYGESTSAVTFKVIRPNGEDAEAMQLYLDAFSPVRGKDFYKLTLDEKRKLFRENARMLKSVADRYPKSLYARLALSAAVSVARVALNDADLARELNSRLISKYLDPNGIGFITAYYMTIHDTQGLRIELKSIIRHYPNTLLSAEAEKKIKELEKEK